MKVTSLDTRAPIGQRGFSIVEMLIVVVIVGLLGLISNTSYRAFRERSILNRAAHVVAADAALTRSYAIRNRANVSLVADESARTYEIRDAGGNVLRTRWFDVDSDLYLTSLDVQTAGDSITFNSRGLLLAAGMARVVVGRASGARGVQVNAVGRSRILAP